MNLNDDKAWVNRVLQGRGGTTGEKRGWIFGLDGIIGTFARMVYQVTYAVVLFASSGNRRDRTRARLLAARVEAAFHRHSPAGLAILFNVMLLWLMASWSLRQDRGEKNVEASSSLVTTPEGFLTDLGQDNANGGPATGGGGGATSHSPQTPSQLVIPPPPTPTANPTATTNTLIASAPQPFNVPTPTLTHPILNLDQLPHTQATPNTSDKESASAKGTDTIIGHGNGQGQGQGDGQGSGHGHGSGGGHGGGTFAGFTTAGNNNGSGSKGPRTITGLRNMDLVVLVDCSNFTGDGGGYTGQKAISKNIILPIKINLSLLPNILAQRNTILETRTATDDSLWEQNYSVHVGTEFKSLHEALITVATHYIGRKNTAIVIGSEFEHKPHMEPREKIDQLRHFILSLKLPIFFISLGDEPDRWFITLANDTGGAYLGMIHASRAKALALREKKLWPLVIMPIGPKVPKGEPQPNTMFFNPPHNKITPDPTPHSGIGRDQSNENRFN